MADYKNEKCIACGKIFQDNDDIVVCPECGTPYHRDCYRQNGKCINDRLHELNLSWFDEKQKEKSKNNNNNSKSKSKESASASSNCNSGDVIICKNCSMPNSKSSTFCTRCGQLLNDPANSDENNSYNQDKTDSNGRFSKLNSPFDRVNVDINGKNFRIKFGDPYAGMDPDDDFDGAKLSNVAEFVDENRVAFLLVFQKFKARASKISTNVACLFVPYAYFAYRKMWGMCFALIALFSLFSIPQILSTFISLDTSQLDFGQSTDASVNAYYQQLTMVLNNFQNSLSAHEVLINNLSTIFQGLTLAVRLLLFFFGNYIYYRHCIKTVKSIQDNSPVDTINYECKYKGGVKPVNIIISFIARFGFEIIAYMAVMSTLLSQI